MGRIVEHNETFTGKPTSYDTVNSTISPSNPERGYNFATNTSSSNTAYVTLNGVYGETLYAFYDFQISNIPSNATINSLSCQARASVSSTNANRGYSYVQLYNGTIAKGSQTQILSNANIGEAYTLNVGDWTVSELDKLKIRISIQRTNRGNTYYCRFRGATLTINYTWYETFYSISTSSNVQGVSISSTSDETLEGGSSTITLSNVSDISSICVMDNGNDVTSLFTGGGPTYTYELSNIQEDHVISVESASSATKNTYIKNNGWVSGTDILKKDNDNWGSVKYTRIYIHNGTAWIEDAQRTILAKGIMTDV